jgi:GTP-binding protein EngB required for normal cell division
MSHEGLDTLEQLQTPQQVELLDKIDDLRSQGLGHYDISLPQLIVCGNQSSGKSSLLERLTRLRFPTGDNMCTKFATEVVLRKEKDVEIEFTITPGKIRSKAEKFGLGKFKQTFSSRESFDFRSVTEEAKKQMLCGAKEKDNMIFEDILRVRYSGPDLPSLTVVDLPGLIETDVTRGDAVKKIDELVTRYMKDEKSIILAILDASNDVNCQKVFEHLKIFDPTYSRTLGILTKTDLLEPGSKKEEGMLEMAKNEGYLRMRHRWHAVSNRKFGVKDPSLEERDEAERKFFGSGLWSSLPEADVGITSLRAKLSRVLLEHIGRELPSLVKAVKDAVATTEAGLKLLGTGRDTVAQQRSYLASHALNFHTLTNDALRGIYGNPFFALSSPDKAAIARLRTKVQNLNIAFTQTMYTKGHTWNIASTDQFSPPASRDGCSEAVLEYGSQFEDPEPISREEFLESHIGACVRDSRQSGLPSLVNPLVVGEIFRQQSHNWRDHATYHLERVFTAISDYVEEALRSLVDPYTCSMLMIKQVRPELDRRWSSAEAKLEELLLPYTEQEPITYDPSFVHQLDALRMARYAADCTAQETSQAKAKRPAWFRPQHPTKHLLTESIDEYTNSEILDLMQTYYRVSFLSLFFCTHGVTRPISNPKILTDYLTFFCVF